jgi:hypothetical protein
MNRDNNEKQKTEKMIMTYRKEITTRDIKEERESIWKITTHASVNIDNNNK